MKTLEELLSQIEARANAASEGPWVWGDWTIFDKDRPAQKRKEPFWTLIKPGRMCLTQGPVGRKSLNITNIASGCGYEESDINVSDADADFIAHSRTDVPTLLAMLRLAIEVLKDIKCGCGGRAKIFGEDLKRCPTCASAERADEGLNELLKLAGGE